MNKFCQTCNDRRHCSKICPALDAELVTLEAERKEFSLFQDDKKKTSDHIIEKIEASLFRENLTLAAATWQSSADPLSHTLADYSLPHLTDTENKIRYLFEVAGHPHAKIAAIMKIKKENCRKIYSQAAEKARLGTQEMAEKHPGRYSRTYVLIKPNQTRAAALAMRKKGLNRKSRNDIKQL